MSSTRKGGDHPVGRSILASMVMLGAQACCYLPGPAPTSAPAPLAYPSGYADPGRPMPAAAGAGAPTRGRPHTAGGVHLDEASLAAFATAITPQAPDPRSLFDRAEPHDGQTPIERGMLVCQATVRGGGYDDGIFGGGADVALRMRVGSGAIQRTTDTSLRIYTIPFARLAPGDSIWVRVVDRDIIFDDTIAEGSTSFARAPFTMTMGQADVECRTVARSAIERGASRATAAVRHAADALGAPEPDLAAEQAGYPRARVEAATNAVGAALAWVVFSDEELQQHVRQLQAFEDAWRTRVSDEVGEARRTLPAPTEAQALPGAGQVRVTSLDCGSAGDRLRDVLPADPLINGYGCISTLELTASSGFTLGPTSGAGATFESWGLDIAGNQVDAHIISRRMEGTPAPPPTAALSVPAGGRVTLLLEYASSTPPALLRLRRGAGPLLLRVE